MALALRPPLAGCAAAQRSRRAPRCSARAPLRVAAAAADDLCKDKVSSPKDLRGTSSTICTVNFKGADGNMLPVEMPEVRPADVALRGRGL
jgi:hypothetical protein